MQAPKLPVAIATILLLILAFTPSPTQAAQLRLSWNAPTTNEDGTPLSDLAGYMLYYGRTSGNYEFSVDVGNQTTYVLSGLEDGQLYYFSVTAYDTSDNESDYSNEVSAVPSPPPPAPLGLVAAYNFDEGSGTTAADASGNGNAGAISGATWTTQGKFGNALVFDGIDDWLTTNDAPSLDLTTGMTLSAWVYPTVTLTGWKPLIVKEQTGGIVYYLYANSPGNQPATAVFIGDEQILSGGAALPANTWTYLAATYDGVRQRLYINGIEVANRAQTGQIQISTGPLRIGGEGVWGDHFQGRIDEVRIYNRALTADEIQADMNVSVTPPPAGAPVAAFTATPLSGAAPLTVAFSDASTGSITAWSWDFGDGGTSTVQNPSHTYTSPGTYTVSLTVSGPGGADTETTASYISVTVPPPTAAFTATPLSGAAPLTVAFSDASTGSITAWSWDFGDGGTSTVQNPSHTYTSPGTYTVSLTVSGPGGSTTATRPNYITIMPSSEPPPVAAFTATPLSGAAPLTVAFSDASTGSITAWSWDFGDGGTSTVQNPSHTYTSPGTYTVSLTVSGPGGSDSGVKADYITVITSPNPSGLMAAYSFGEGSGTVVADASGNGNNGTISGAKWTTQGRFGNALVFDGVNDWVTIPDANSLDLTNGLTLSAWVYPTTTPTGWRTVIQKDQAGGAVYYLYANSDANRPATGVFIGAERILYGGTRLPASTWTHLTATYDGMKQRLYVNGVEVASRAQTGQILVSSGHLRIGGNSVWGAYFKGRIDEVRIYNRPLSASEIQADMNTPIQ